jgi:hypothetical protein
MFSRAIPKSTMTLDTEMFTIMQLTIMLVQLLVIHLVVVMVSKKKAVLHLSTKAKVIEASQKEKFMVKEIVTEFNVGKT